MGSLNADNVWEKPLIEVPALWLQRLCWSKAGYVTVSPSGKPTVTRGFLLQGHREKATRLEPGYSAQPAVLCGINVVIVGRLQVKADCRAFQRSGRDLPHRNVERTVACDRASYKSHGEVEPHKNCNDHFRWGSCDTTRERKGSLPRCLLCPRSRVRVLASILPPQNACASPRETSYNVDISKGILSQSHPWNPPAWSKLWQHKEKFYLPFPIQLQSQAAESASWCSGWT